MVLARKTVFSCADVTLTTRTHDSAYLYSSGILALLAHILRIALPTHISPYIGPPIHLRRRSYSAFILDVVNTHIIKLHCIWTIFISVEPFTIL